MSRVYDVKLNVSNLTVLDYLETNFKLPGDNFHPQMVKSEPKQKYR